MRWSLASSNTLVTIIAFSRLPRFAMPVSNVSAITPALTTMTVRRLRAVLVTQPRSSPYFTYSARSGL